MPNSWVCVDAGCVVRLFTEPDDERYPALWRRWRAEDRRVVAPRLLRYEVTNVLYRSRREASLRSVSLESALQTVLALPIELRDDDDLHEMAFRFAERFSLPAAYDAHYLALADRLGAVFWTTDRRLANAIGSDLPWVRLVGG